MSPFAHSQVFSTVVRCPDHFPARVWTLRGGWVSPGLTVGHLAATAAARDRRPADWEGAEKLIGFRGSFKITSSGG